MRKIGISVLSVFLLFFFASAIQAQNQSAENSDVILFHSCYDFTLWVDCPEQGIITFSGEVQEIVKSLPNGTITAHYNAIGEGTDEFGGEWRWHDVWIQRFPADYPDNFHMNRTVITQGSKGAKLTLKGLWIVRDGETIQFKYEADCP